MPGMSDVEPPVPRVGARQLALLAVPAILVGIASSLILLTLSAIAGWLEGILWTSIPDGLGVDGDGSAWIMVVLVLTGVAVGLVVTFMPGRAGPHPATVGLAGPPLAVSVLPSLAVALVLMLAGGVSLGPENPIMGINIGLAAFLGSRLLGRVPAAAWVGMAFSGTIGAMFGTPVAAALLLSEQAGDPRVSTWDRLFAPLVAAAAGSIVTDVLANDTFTLPVLAYPGPELIDLVTGSLIAMAAALIGLVAVYLFPAMYAAFQRIPTAFLQIVAGGIVLGVLGAIGGTISLFKGLSEMQELTASVGDYSAGQLGFLVILKLVAVVVASTAGFRGGRIFPVVFAAVALGLCLNDLFPQVPQSLTVAASLLGLLVATTRSGWLALFMSAFLVGEATMLPIMCIAVLPAWLLVTGRPEMVVEATSPASPTAAAAAPSA